MDAAAMNFNESNTSGATGRVRVIEANATHEDRTWATFIHLSGLAGFTLFKLAPIIPVASIVVPLILWLIKRHDSAFLDDHGREALNFQISMALYYPLLALSCVGIPLMILLPFVQIIAPIVMAVRANGGEYVRYPITIRFLK